MKDVEPKETQNGEVQSTETAMSNGNGQSTNGSQNEVDESPEEQSEITLTDHLNKRLLSSFLDRINQNPTMFATNNNTTENDDFIDEPQ